MNYMKLSFKRVIKNKFNYIPIMLIFVALIILLIFNYGKGKDYLVSSLDAQNKMTTAYNDSVKKELNNKKENDTDREYIEKTIIENEKSIELHNEILMNIRTQKWTAAYHLLSKKVSEDIVIFEGTSQSDEENSRALEANNDVLNFLNKEKAIYEGLEKTNFEYEVAEMPYKGWMFYNWSLEWLYPFLVIVAIIFVLTSAFTQNYIDGFDIGIIYPYSKLYKRNLDLLVGSILGIGTFVFVSIFNIMVASIINGSGSLKYPTAYYNHGTNSYFTKKIFYTLFNSNILYIIYIILIVEVVYLISKMIKNQTTTLFVSLLLIVGGMIMLLIVSPIQEIAHIIPFAYGFSTRVINGDLSNAFNNSSITFSQGVFILGTSIVIIYLMIGAIDDRKRFTSGKK